MFGAAQELQRRLGNQSHTKQETESKYEELSKEHTKLFDEQQKALQEHQKTLDGKLDRMIIIKRTKRH